jgi:hypothetical protein
MDAPELGDPHVVGSLVPELQRNELEDPPEGLHLQLVRRLCVIGDGITFICNWSYMGERASLSSSSSSIPCTGFSRCRLSNSGETGKSASTLCLREKVRRSHPLCGGMLSILSELRTGKGGGRGMTNGCRVAGSRPSSCRRWASKMIPVSAFAKSIN